MIITINIFGEELRDAVNFWVKHKNPELFVHHEITEFVEVEFDDMQFSRQISDDIMVRVDLYKKDEKETKNAGSIKRRSNPRTTK